MTHLRRATAAGALCALLGLAAGAAAQQRPGTGVGQPARDTPAQDLDAATATLSGRVVAADTGAIVKRATVSLRGQDRRGRRAVQTDDAGRYLFTGLAPGRYTITVSKPGFITVAYGQQHPRQPAVPVHLAEGATLEDVDLALPRGSVITGHVADEDGAPLPRAVVTVDRFVYRQGERELVTVGSDQTDDRGQFRVFDLDPGEYYVSVTLPRRPPGLAGRAGRGGRGGLPTDGNDDTEPETTGFAPTYYPGVITLGEATSLTLGLSEELSGVNFAARLVRLATVSGVAIGPDGAPAAGLRIMLLPLEGAERGPGRTPGGMVDRDGRFEIRDVPPGRYSIQTMPNRRRGREQVYANQHLSVDGQDLTGLALLLQRGSVLEGRVTFDGNPLDPEVIDRLEVTTLPVGPAPIQWRGGSARVEADGDFALGEIGGGDRLIRLNRLPDTLQLKEVWVEGRNVIDTPLDLGGGRTIAGITLVVTDQITELTGRVTDDRGAALTDYTVIAFPTDEALWGPRSRHVTASRPDQNATYRMRGLPPGDYLLSVVEVVEEGEWFDPRFLDALRGRAARVSLDPGDHRSLDLTLR